ncbi:MAG: hypothetical protein HXS46_13525 [Theionarchaea archaeon]|nr:MAG: hypothetical protein AYK18_15590 [Theionarchaea archaeon DG-70]MBU7011702.1 hypothetical protein [Theionarchaea archaeon]
MGDRVYIVDYDIPEKPAKERIQFYRDMKKLQNSQTDYSTLSVFRTKEKYIAQAVYLLVVAHGGHGHVYYGEEITDLITV